MTADTFHITAHWCVKLKFRRVALTTLSVTLWALRDLNTLVCAFAGANQLLWYYADLEKQRCYQEHLESGQLVSPDIHTTTLSPLANGSNYYIPQNIIQQDINHCLAWRRFSK